MIFPKVERFSGILEALKYFRGKIIRRDKPLLVRLENGLNSGLEVVALNLVLLVKCGILPVSEREFAFDVKYVGKIDFVIKDFLAGFMDVLNKLSEK